MSDTEQTGAQSVAPVEQTPAPAVSAEQSAPVQVAAPAPVADAPAQEVKKQEQAPSFVFGTSRGSGLARGKRQAPSQATAAATNGGYQPTAIEVVKTATTFANPFEPVAAAAAPQQQAEPVEAKPSVKTEVSAPVDSVAANQPPEPVAAQQQRPEPAEGHSQTAQPAAKQQAEPVEAPADGQPSTLNILPPAETKRPTSGWENRGERQDRGERRERGERQDRGERRERGEFRDRGERQERGDRGERVERRDDRPTFRPERRDEQAASSEAPAQAPRPAPEAKPEAKQEYKPAARTEEKPAKKGGFFAWLKSLFSSDEPEAKPADGKREFNDRRNDRRGGRGRDNRGGNRGGFQPRDGQQRHEGGQHGDQGGEGGQRRRRRRGGRGRHGGDRGDFRQGGGDSGHGNAPQA